MKILMLTPYLPYPLFSGGQIRSYNIIKELSKNHEITLFAVTRTRDEDQYIPKLSVFCKNVVTFERGSAFSLSHIMLSGLTLLPFILAVYKMPKLQEALEEKLREGNYDVIHVETFYLMHNMPKTGIPIVLFEQNIEYEVYRKFANTFTPSFLRPILYLDIYKIKKWEEYFWKKANALVVMSEVDKRYVNRAAFVCGNGVDAEKFKPEVKSHPFDGLRASQPSAKRVLFIGNFKWVENKDAATWILTAIWPKIRSSIPIKSGLNSLKLWIVGREIPDSIRRLTKDKDVIFDENAPDDTAEIFRQADVLLAPIRVGGGTSFKMLEAMASGVPVVTTRLGISGLGAGDREEMLVADDTEKLAENVVTVLQDEKLRAKLIENARKLVEQKYDWKIIVNKMEETYQSVVHHG